MNDAFETLRVSIGAAKIPRDPCSILLEAELVASSPERVYDWLEERAKRTEVARIYEDEELEQALLRRGEPFIDLALARFGICTDVLRELLRRTGAQAEALRIAALSNIADANVAFSGAPSAFCVCVTFSAVPKTVTHAWRIAAFNAVLYIGVAVRMIAAGFDRWTAVRKDGRQRPE